MKILYSLPVKIITFILLLACTAVMIAVGMNFTKTDLKNLNSLTNPDFKESYEYRNTLQDINSKLCVLSEFYLEGMKDDGTVELNAETKQALQYAGVLDQNYEVKTLSVDFIYYAAIGGHSISNNSQQTITKEYIKENFNTYYYRINNLAYSSDNSNAGMLYNKYITSRENEIFSEYKDDNAALTLYIAPKNEYINQHQQQLTAAVGQVKKIVKDLIPLMVLAFLLIIIQIIITGKTNKNKPLDEAAIDNKNSGRIYIELVIAGMSACVLCAVFIVAGFYYFKQAVELLYSQFLVFQIIYSIFLTILVGLFFLGFLYLVRRLKQRNFFKSSLSYRILSKIAQTIKKFWRDFILMDSYKNHTISKRLFLRQVVFFALIGFILFVSFIFIISSAVFLGFLNIMLAFGLVVVYMHQNNQDFKELSVLCEHVDQLYKGNNEFQSIVSPNSPVAVPAMQLNNISDGVKKSVDRQVKAERTKIDLVTNVSHDLKTPLTSIIGYIDLLAKQELNPEAMDYVKILEQKADRLKKIVSDLFELAKITSGNEEMDLEELDCVVLVKQVVADMEDAVLVSGKTIKINFDQESAPIYADGKKLYRVFQNLFDNALKYSMDGTRIFVDLKVGEDVVVTTIKNTASYELDFNTDEILERFTRGDKSRSGEGNGLGLSIAKGFANACGGDLTIDVDVDMFKASVSFPIIKYKE